MVEAYFWTMWRCFESSNALCGPVGLTNFQNLRRIEAIDPQSTATGSRVGLKGAEACRRIPQCGRKIIPARDPKQCVCV